MSCTSSLDPKTLFRAFNHHATLNIANPEDRKYYTDFSDVRGGGGIIEEMESNITWADENEYTCQLFTGHIGCGKSTELLRLKAMLEKAGYFVVFFDSSLDLEMGDVDISDILMAVARQVSESLKTMEAEPGMADMFRSIFEGMINVLKTEVEVKGKLKIPSFGEVSADSKGLTVSTAFGEFSAKAKGSPAFRNRLRQYMEPQINSLIKAINEELLEPAVQRLREKGKQGLVVIVDSLDKVESTLKPNGKPQPEYLFVDRGEQLKLKCHMVYTIPIALNFSNEYGRMTDRFATPYVLPMIPVKYRGARHEQGIDLLRQMILKRVFPCETDENRVGRISEMFDSLETTDTLCMACGGHVRGLIRFVHRAIQKYKKAPLTEKMIAEVIRERRNQLMLPISDDEWEMLKKVKQTKKVQGDEGYAQLLRSMFVYEYRDEDGSWFDVNPVIADAKELV
ncbi:MAG: ATP-binding protein [Desulfobacterales bacterium]|nr:ATP-binding protein [Desulfobacterales bacterium]